MESENVFPITKNSPKCSDTTFIFTMCEIWKYIHIQLSTEQINFISNPDTFHGIPNLMRYFPQEIELTVVK